MSQSKFDPFQSQESSIWRLVKYFGLAIFFLIQNSQTFVQICDIGSNLFHRKSLSFQVQKCSRDRYLLRPASKYAILSQIYFTENRYNFRYKSALETGTFSDLLYRCTKFSMAVLLLLVLVVVVSSLDGLAILVLPGYDTTAVAALLEYYTHTY